MLLHHLVVDAVGVVSHNQDPLALQAPQATQVVMASREALGIPDPTLWLHPHHLKAKDVRSAHHHRMDHQDLRALQDQMVNRVNQAKMLKVVGLDQGDHQDLQDQMVAQGSLVAQGNLDLLVKFMRHRDKMDQLGHQDLMVNRVDQDNQGQMATQATLDPLALQEMVGHQDRTATQEAMGRRDPMERRAARELATIVHPREPRQDIKYDCLLHISHLFQGEDPYDDQHCQPPTAFIQ
jgi:hypothetical protein